MEKFPEKKAMVETSKERLKPKNGAKERSSLGERIADSVSSVSLSDFADFTGLSLIKDLGVTDFLVDNFNLLRVREAAASLQSDLETVIPSEDERKEYYSVLADFLKQTNATALGDLIYVIQNEFNVLSDTRAPVNSTDGVLQARRYLFSVERLKKFVGIAKSMPAATSFLAPRYFQQLPPGVKIEGREQLVPFGEVLEIVRKNNNPGGEIVIFIEAQADKPNFDKAKKFILSHVEGFNKISKFLDEPSYPYLNLDLLNAGDHFEVLEKLLLNNSFVLTRAIDRDYLKRYGDELLEMCKITTVVPPDKAEMMRHGSELIKIVRETGEIPSHRVTAKDGAEYYVTKITAQDRKIFAAFGWAAGAMFSSDEVGQKRLLKLIKLPENRKLLDDFYGMFLAVEAQHEQYRKANGGGTKYMVQLAMADFFRRFLLEGGVQDMDELSVDLQKPEIGKFVEYYKKYPRIVAALAGKMLHYGNALDMNDVLGVNSVVLMMEREGFSSEYLAMVTDVLEWMPVLGPSGYRVKNLDSRMDSSLLLAFMLSKDKVKIVHENREFLKSYLADINFNSGNLVTDLLEKFPLNLLGEYKGKLEELAKKYPNKEVLKGIILSKIKNIEDLNFYIDNSERIGQFYGQCKTEDVRGRYGEKDNTWYELSYLIENSPSRLFLQAHLGDLEKFMARAEKGDVKKTFLFLKENEELVLKHGTFLFKVLNLLPKVDVDDLWVIASGIKGREAFVLHDEEKILFIARELAEGGGGYGLKIVDVIEALRVPDERYHASRDKSWPEVKEFIAKFRAKDGSRTFRVDLLKDVLFFLASDSAPVFWGADDFLEGVIKLYVAGFSKTSIEETDDLGSSLERFLSGWAVDFRNPNRSAIIDGVEDFFEEEGEGPNPTDKVAYANYKKRAGNLLNYLAVIGRRPENMYQEVNEYSRYLNLHDVFVIDFLKSEGAGDEVINKYTKEAKELYADAGKTKEHQKKYLFTDQADGADLEVFDYNKESLYKRIFENLRHIGWTSLEGDFLKNLRFDKFEKDIAGKDFFELEKIVNLFGNDVDPKLGYTLFKAVFFKKELGWLVQYFKGFLATDAKGKKKIDVTQNNLPQINAVLRTLSKYKDWCEEEKYPGVAANHIIATIKAVFPEFVPTGKPDADLRWFLEKFDVEEINFQKLDSFTEFTEFQQFYNTIAENSVEGSTKYLENKFADIDFSKMSFDGEGYSVFDIKGIEKLRSLLNARSRVVGDMLVNMIGSKFLEQHCCSVENLGKLLEFARAWESPEADRDVNGLYQIYSVYAYVEIAAFIKERIERDKSGEGRENLEKELEKVGVKDFDGLIESLEEKGYLVLTEGNVSKALTNLGKGMIRYTFRKGAQKIWGGESVDFDGRSINVNESSWSREGAKVYSIMPEGGEEIATLIKCDPTKMKVKVLAEADGMVNMEAEASRLGRRLVFSAPLTFTTGARKMTELAFRDGVQMNYLLSPYSKDGFLLATPEGEQKVLNKTRLKLGDLLTVEDFKNPEIVETVTKWANGNKIKVDESNLAVLLEMAINPVQRFLDKNTFFSLLRLKKYSLLGGMLLIDKEAGKDEGTVVKLDDRGDSRRLFLEFGDGQFGVIDSTENMTTGKMVELALAMGATKAIYMDTGMYDMATYRDGKGEDHIMGHQDTSESTNRVVIYER